MVFIAFLSGLVAVGAALVFWPRSKTRGHLADDERRELAERILALGVSHDEIEPLVARKDDEALIARHRLEHRRLAARKGPFR